LNFVKDFPATMKKFFCDIPEKFQPIFWLVEDYLKTMKESFSNLLKDVVEEMKIWKSL
jgi:hypothetical protein